MRHCLLKMQLEKTVLMTKNLTLQLGFSYNNKRKQFVDESGTVTLDFDSYMINGHDKTCYVHIDNNDMNSVGSLDFSYLEELNLIFDKVKLAEKTEVFLASLEK